MTNLPLVREGLPENSSENFPLAEKDKESCHHAHLDIKGNPFFDTDSLELFTVAIYYALQFQNIEPKKRAAAFTGLRPLASLVVMCLSRTLQ